jgi:hypothetical protein
MVTSENWNTMKVRIFIHSIFKSDVEVLWDTPEEVTYLNEEIFDPLNGPILSQDSSYFIGNTNTNRTHHHPVYFEQKNTYDVEPRHHGEAIWLETLSASSGCRLKIERWVVYRVCILRTSLTYQPTVRRYQYKRDEHGKVILYESREVIRGDYAEFGIDYFETFSPVAKIESVR